MIWVCFYNSILHLLYFYSRILPSRFDIIQANDPLEGIYFFKDFPGYTITSKQSLEFHLKLKISILFLKCALSDYQQLNRNILTKIPIWLCDAGSRRIKNTRLKRKLYDMLLLNVTIIIRTAVLKMFNGNNIYISTKCKKREHK